VSLCKDCDMDETSGFGGGMGAMDDDDGQQGSLLQEDK